MDEEKLNIANQILSEEAEKSSSFGKWVKIVRLSIGALILSSALAGIAYFAIEQFSPNYTYKIIISTFIISLVSIVILEKNKVNKSIKTALTFIVPVVVAITAYIIVNN